MRTAQLELLLYWSYVQSQTVHLSQEGWVRKRDLHNIRDGLLRHDQPASDLTSEKDFARLHFMRLMLQELGLLMCQHRELRVASSPGQVPQFWHLPLSARVTASLDAWVRMKGWSELSRLRLSSLDLDLCGARQKVIQELERAPVTTWLAAERFFDHLVATSPPLLFTLHGGWRSRPEENGKIEPHNGKLSEIEASFVGSALSGPLHWLGLLDVCRDGDRLLAFRINASAAHALGLASKASRFPEDDARLVVQPNFRIFALGSVSEAVLAQLELFAERITAGAAAFEYALSRETVYTAQQQGISASQITTFLEQHASLPVPSNVQLTLHEWGQQHERIIVRRAISVCEAHTPEVLDQFWASGDLRIHLEKRLGPTVAMVRRGQTTALQEALLQRGILPAVSSSDAPCMNRLRLMPDGELRPSRKGPDLLLRTCLPLLAQERAGVYYVTEEAVKAAIALGTSIPDYLQKLQSLHHGPLPSNFLARIKAWGSYHGKAHLRQAILLEVGEASTADDLLSDPELASFLARFPGDPSGKLLLVQMDDREQLRLALAARGVQLA